MDEVAAKPLTRDEALAKLRALEPEIRALGIASLYLFGSTARNQAGPDSDVDLFGDMDPTRDLGFAYFGLRRELGDRVGHRVDFMERGALHPLIKTQVEADAIRVF